MALTPSLNAAGTLRNGTQGGGYQSRNEQFSSNVSQYQMK